MTDGFSIPSMLIMWVWVAFDADALSAIMFTPGGVILLITLSSAISFLNVLPL